MTPDNNNDQETWAVAVPRDDPDMKQAYREARDTVEAFITSLRNPTPTQGYFAVKIRLSDACGDDDEYVWLRDVSYNDLAFTGEMSSVPAGPSYKVGDRYRVDKNDIYDWMIVDNGNLVGGYTIRAARRKMSVESRRQFDEHLWFDVD